MATLRASMLENLLKGGYECCILLCTRTYGK